MRIITGLFVALLLSATAAHAQNQNANRSGSMMLYRGQSADGSTWAGTSQTDGGQTFSNFRGSDSRTRSCTSQTYGGQTFTNCN